MLLKALKPSSHCESVNQPRTYKLNHTSFPFVFLSQPLPKAEEETLVSSGQWFPEEGSRVRFVSGKGCELSPPSQSPRPQEVALPGTYFQ